MQAVVARRAPDNPILRQLADSAGKRLAQARSCGCRTSWSTVTPPGNARIGLGTPILFDWGDSRIGTPSSTWRYSIVCTDRPGRPRRLLASHLEQALPSSDPGRAWRLLRPLAALRAAVVCQHFLDDIEPSERIYHQEDVRPALKIAARLAAHDSSR